MTIRKSDMTGHQWECTEHGPIFGENPFCSQCKALADAEIERHMGRLGHEAWAEHVPVRVPSLSQHGIPISAGYLPAEMFEFIATIHPVLEHGSPHGISPHGIEAGDPAVTGWALVQSGVTSDGKVVAVWARRKA